ncbi:multicopper oxidase domain-containing protein [Streptomyces sp. NPDC005483]|uniref:multicopper oxidase domain-containing protein n=1 Tax=Streptomyces sp. NPDC005483 TaxID=3154882 RepID=UPI0033BA7FFE
MAGRTPGKEWRVTARHRIAATLSNQLPDRTTASVHWHGIALRDNMDGAPPATQSAVRTGHDVTDRFRTDTPGTCFSTRTSVCSSTAARTAPPPPSPCVCVRPRSSTTTRLMGRTGRYLGSTWTSSRATEARTRRHRPPQPARAAPSRPVSTDDRSPT